MQEQYDVIVIGAGVVGSAIARELSRYRLRIAVLEKNLDVCNETTQFRCGTRRLRQSGREPEGALLRIRK